MIDQLLGIVAPHHCYGCQKSGYVLCENCKYDIVDEAIDACLVCRVPTPNGICSNHKTTYQKAWCVGDRIDSLQRLIDAYKFERVRGAADSLAFLLNERLPVLPANTVIVPVPTIHRHVRQRGYDHTLLIAKQLAKLRGLTAKQLILRRDKIAQRGLTRQQRFGHAESAYYCLQDLDQTPYLIVDDIVTTNATLKYCAQTLRDAGADTVWVGVVARQELKK